MALNFARSQVRRDARQRTIKDTGSKLDLLLWPPFLESPTLRLCPARMTCILLTPPLATNPSSSIFSSAVLDTATASYSPSRPDLPRPSGRLDGQIAAGQKQSNGRGTRSDLSPLPSGRRGDPLLLSCDEPKQNSSPSGLPSSGFRNWGG